MIDLGKLTTESRNSRTLHLDEMSPIEIITAMNEEDTAVLEGVRRVLPQIAQGVSWVEEALSSGGRLIYMGAGTSGRLGVLDASECPPTFGVSPDLVIGLIAGGDYALRNPVENAEDSVEMGKNDLRERELSQRDVVVGIAASGRTPYVIGGLEYAKELGCRTISITCNQHSKMAEVAQLAIEVIVGPEVLTGSTRLKSGTAQKMVLNMLTTGAMVRLGKAYQNLMVDVVQSNAKLKVRAENIVMEATAATREEAKRVLALAEGSVKTAVVMILARCDKESATQKLSATRGHVRKAIAQNI